MQKHIVLLLWLCRLMALTGTRATGLSARRMGFQFQRLRVFLIGPLPFFPIPPTRKQSAAFVRSGGPMPDAAYLLFSPCAEEARKC